jgi:hypothetical protein
MHTPAVERLAETEPLLQTLRAPTSSDKGTNAPILEATHNSAVQRPILSAEVGPNTQPWENLGYLNEPAINRSTRHPATPGAMLRLRLRMTEQVTG